MSDRNTRVKQPTHWGVLVLLLVFMSAAMAPLADPDLPMHLAIGRWIVEHGSVPTQEPFAWTRDGAPYFAYSWLMQVIMYGAMRLAGPVGLRVVHGILAAGSFAAVLCAGRALGWTPRATLLVAALQAVVLSAVSSLLRPQVILFVLLPLAWAATARALREPEFNARRDLWWLSLLALVAAVAANSHIVFPLVAAPLALALTAPRDVMHARTRSRLRRALPATAAILFGWLCSPYALHWPQVFALNFRENALFGPSSLVAESLPGFEGRFGLGVLLVVVPLIASVRWTARDRLVFGTMWVVGLVAFALKTKALLIWWFVSFPLVGMAAEVCLSLSPAYRAIPPLLALVVPLSAALGYLAGVRPTILPLADAWRAEHVVPGVTLSSPAAIVTDTLIQQLAAIAPTARVLTVFDLGSYIPWRAPGLSQSIDGRTIFPDSAALPDAVLLPTSLGRALGPWRSADAALVPLNYPIAVVLDTATGWRRLATHSVSSSPLGPVGLWLRSMP